MSRSAGDRAGRRKYYGDELCRPNGPGWVPGSRWWQRWSHKCHRRLAKPDLRLDRW